MDQFTPQELILLHTAVTLMESWKRAQLAAFADVLKRSPVPVTPQAQLALTEAEQMADALGYLAQKIESLQRVTH